MFSQLRKLAGHSLMYSLVNALTKFINFLLLPLYTRLLTESEYGTQDLVLTTLSLIGIISVLGMDAAGHRWYWDSEDLTLRKRTIASWTWCQLSITFVFALIIWAMADVLATAIIENRSAALYFRLAAIGQFMFSALPDILRNWLRLQQRPKTMMFFTLGTSLLAILTTIVFVAGFKWGLFGVFAAPLLSQGVATLIAIALFGDWINPKYVSLPHLRGMLRYSLPLVPASLAFWVVSLSDRYFVQAYGSTDEVGLYSVGARLATVVVLLTTGFQQAWGPFSMSIRQRPDANKTYAQVLLIYVWLGCLLCLGLTLFAPNFVLLATAGGRWVDAAPVIGPLAFSFVMIGLQAIAGLGLEIKKKSISMASAFILAAFLNIIFNFLLVPTFGKVGSAWATLLAQSVIPIMLFYQSQRAYPIPYPFGTVFLLFGIAFVAAFAGSNIQLPNSNLTLLLKIAIWLGFGLLAIGLKPQMLASISRTKSSQ
ncbi:MAG: oligosaccharide flippase family protein [Chloroflexi bacterium]|nr:oligosaccharide flippase family protein [Chloroflexota bacterium]